VLLGLGDEDDAADAKYLAEKIAHLRIFPDEAGKMNLSLLDVGGEMLIVSQFTLYGDCRKGRRPSFAHAAAPERGAALYEAFVEEIRAKKVPAATGRFGEMMLVEIVNDGPVTLLLDSKGVF
ncbi:MAG: D-aminoacyl-tRNA deacylase, partial [bacterium]|nr:D-aminoacyl-tRNA deacylase [bacterium]